MSLPLQGRQGALLHRLDGPILEAQLAGVGVGEVCEVRRHWRDAYPSARAQVIGFKGPSTVLSLLGRAEGLSCESMLLSTGAAMSLHCSPALLGTVVNAHGEVTERWASEAAGPQVLRRLDAAPLDYRERQPVNQVLATGIRVIDALLTCGVGQRVGIFASAGSGKTTLMNMLIEHASADVFVIGLIGERGREVTEFVHALRASDKRDRCVVVYASSDQPSADRCNAALLATTVAEYFRDQGANVILLMDSITRYARARRDLALAAAEAPARRGYPASVFEALPRLLERAGRGAAGSVTAFYTVLLESDDDPDPIAEEVRSILDGHIYLDRTLAARGHYPAINLLNSASRVARQVTTPETQALADKTRDLLGRLADLQMLLDLGEYRAGENAANDHAVACKAPLEQWCRQPLHQGCDFETSLVSLHDILR
ncbi:MULTISPECIES: type III secretion system ATPase SctN [Pseudomonas]|uniref:protein-secreting ATPase n=1 Tax=Pseudomonas quercus TaxID=2722792 RepID=A0ABX0Y946_9PSED|nr:MULTISPECIES: type III secretion system ATPase SctN [Pseudomonas]MBF7141006.1 type III secretion system ATPase SctN [Pseudomonas sp. LY10J]NJO99540.1 FliI/YscN family ATPase [Pseudomonas quercus]